MSRRLFIALLFSYLLAWALSIAVTSLNQLDPDAVQFALDRFTPKNAEAEFAFGQRPSFFRLREDELALIPNIQRNHIERLMNDRLQICIRLIIYGDNLDKILLSVKGVGPKTLILLKRFLRFPKSDCHASYLFLEEQI